MLATFALSFVTVFRWLDGRVNPAHAVPAWIVPCVATLDIPVTGMQMPMAWASEINLLACAVGAMLALVLFAIIVSRLVHGEPLALSMTPSLMILIAPFAVGFIAYTNVVGARPSVRFSPAWWAIGFPLAALVSAAHMRSSATRRPCGGLPLLFLGR